MEDVLRSCTRVCVREARLKEIKHEMLNSQKVPGHVFFHFFSVCQCLNHRDAAASAELGGMVGTPT